METFESLPAPPPGRRPGGPRSSSEPREELLLLGRAAAGDRRAFDDLYRQYRPRLARFVDRVTRRPQLVGEVINDTMLVVWDRANSFNGQSKLSTWVFAIAYRKAMKALQRIDEPLESVPLQASNAPGPEERYEHRQLSVTLRRAMLRLSPEHRAVVELSYFQGADCREIAQIVDCPPATVKTRIFHARRQLKGMLPGRLEDWL